MVLNNQTDIYFTRARRVCRNGHDKNVLMQIFQRKENAVLCGVDEAIKRMRIHPHWKLASYEPTFKIHSLADGDIVQPYETVMTWEGPYSEMAEWETVVLGILTRATLVATNTRRTIEAANGKPVFYYGARHDHPDTQRTDGYSTLVAGASGVSTVDNAYEFMRKNPEVDNDIIIGTMPHALIAVHGGNTVEACRSFIETYPEIPLMALVDFENDCVRTSLECLREFGDKLKGVRLDTSGTMIDKSCQYRADQVGYKQFWGVNPTLVQNVRHALDKNNGKHVKIMVSGGFNPERIREMESITRHVDSYGVGSSIIKGSNDFTADIVEVGGEDCCKVGRQHNPNPRLKLWAS